MEMTIQEIDTLTAAASGWTLAGVAVGVGLVALACD